MLSGDFLLFIVLFVTVRARTVKDVSGIGTQNGTNEDTTNESDSVHSATRNSKVYAQRTSSIIIIRGFPKKMKRSLDNNNPVTMNTGVPNVIFIGAYSTVKMTSGYNWPPESRKLSWIDANSQALRRLLPSIVGERKYQPQENSKKSWLGVNRPRFRKFKPSIFGDYRQQPRKYLNDPWIGFNPQIFRDLMPSVGGERKPYMKNYVPIRRAQNPPNIFQRQPNGNQLQPESDPNPNLHVARRPVTIDYRYPPSIESNFQSPIYDNTEMTTLSVPKYEGQLYSLAYAFTVVCNPDGSYNVQEMPPFKEQGFHFKCKDVLDEMEELKKPPPLDDGKGPKATASRRFGEGRVSEADAVAAVCNPDGSYNVQKMEVYKGHGFNFKCRETGLSRRGLRRKNKRTSRRIINALVGVSAVLFALLVFLFCLLCYLRCFKDRKRHDSAQHPQWKGIPRYFVLPENPAIAKPKRRKKPPSIRSFWSDKADSEDNEEEHGKPKLKKSSRKSKKASKKHKSRTRSASRSKSPKRDKQKRHCKGCLCL